MYGKRPNKSMKSKDRIKTTKEDWVVVENCHEPIVSQELWDKAHKIMKAKHRPAKTGEVQMFAGLLYCSDCGHCLTYSQKKRKDGTYHGSYTCWLYKTHGKQYCESHYITYDVIYNLVLLDIQKNLFAYRRNTEQFRRFLESRYKSASVKETERIQKDFDKKEKRCYELDKIISRLYEDNVLGRISDERYEVMLKNYESEHAELSKKISELRLKLDEVKKQSDSAEMFINVIRKYTIVDQLDASILNELIDKIIIHKKEGTDDGRQFQQIEIYYKFVGKIEK